MRYQVRDFEWALARDVDYFAVDVETSCSRLSSICQVGLVGFRNGKEVCNFESLIDPQDEFDRFNIGIHGIDPDRVAGQPYFSGVYWQIAERLAGQLVVAHSAFDRRALRESCGINGLPTLRCGWVDTVKVSRRAWPHLASHRLNVVADHLRIRFRHHHALEDARTAGLIMARAIDQTGVRAEDWERELEQT